MFKYILLLSLLFFIGCTPTSNTEKEEPPITKKVTLIFDTPSALPMNYVGVNISADSDWEGVYEIYEFDKTGYQIELELEIPNIPELSMAVNLDVNIIESMNVRRSCYGKFDEEPIICKIKRTPEIYDAGVENSPTRSLPSTKTIELNSAEKAYLVGDWKGIKHPNNEAQDLVVTFYEDGRFFWDATSRLHGISGVPGVGSDIYGVYEVEDGELILWGGLCTGTDNIVLAYCSRRFIPIEVDGSTVSFPNNTFEKL